MNLTIHQQLLVSAYDLDSTNQDLIKALHKEKLVQKEVQVNTKHGVVTRKQWVKTAEEPKDTTKNNDSEEHSHESMMNKLESMKKEGKVDEGQYNQYKEKINQKFGKPYETKKDDEHDYHKTDKGVEFRTVKKTDSQEASKKEPQNSNKAGEQKPSLTEKLNSSKQKLIELYLKTGEPGDMKPAHIALEKFMTILYDGTEGEDRQQVYKFIEKTKREARKIYRQRKQEEKETKLANVDSQLKDNESRITEYCDIMFSGDSQKSDEAESKLEDLKQQIFRKIDTKYYKKVNEFIDRIKEQASKNAKEHPKRAPKDANKTSSQPNNSEFSKVKKRLEDNGFKLDGNEPQLDEALDLPVSLFKGESVPAAKKMAEILRQEGFTVSINHKDIKVVHTWEKDSQHKAIQFDSQHFNSIKSDKKKAMEYLKQSGIKWDEHAHEGVNWMRAMIAMKNHTGQTQPKEKKPVDSTKQNVKDLSKTHGIENLHEMARKAGVKWDEHSHSGINHMRASIAIQRHLKNGGKL